MRRTTTMPAPFPADCLSFAGPGPWGWVLIALGAPGLLVLVGVVVAFIVRPQTPSAGGSGYYHILGVDKVTGKSRETTVQASGPDSARGRAELDGIVATEVRQVDRTA